MENAQQIQMVKFVPWTDTNALAVIMTTNTHMASCIKVYTERISWMQ